MKEQFLIGLLVLNLLASVGLYYAMNARGSAISSRIMSIEKTEIDHGTNILFLMGKKAKP
jgi:hypothetical protein